MYFERQTFLVAGLSRSETAAAEYLLLNGAKVYVFDDVEDANVAEARAALTQKGCIGIRREELSEAVERRLKEELGVRMPVEELYSFVYRAQFENGLTEYEYDHVFLGEYDGEIRLNEEEASEIRWMDMDELAEDLWKNPEKYTAWFLIAAPQVLRRFKA